MSRDSSGLAGFLKCMYSPDLSTEGFHRILPNLFSEKRQWRNGALLVLYEDYETAGAK